MLAKLIVHGKDRNEAIKKMKSALGEVVIEGVHTNIDYAYDIINNKDYISGNFDINFLDILIGIKVDEGAKKFALILYR